MSESNTPERTTDIDAAKQRIEVMAAGVRSGEHTPLHEPTPEMVDAGVKADEEFCSGAGFPDDRENFWRNRCAVIYCAMEAARAKAT